MAEPMKIRASLAGDGTEVRVLMSHEMETGQRKDSAGKTIPAWFIQEVTASHNGKSVLTAQWGPSVAKNPFLQVFVACGYYDPGTTSDGSAIEPACEVRFLDDSGAPAFRRILRAVR